MAVASRKPRFRRVKTRNFRLTPRDVEIIRHVNTYRLLDSNHIVGLLGDGSAQQIRRRLQLLFHNHYLDRPRAQLERVLLDGGNRPVVYALGTAGARLLNVPRKKPMQIQFFEHRLAISAVMVSFAVACREHPTVRLIPWTEMLLFTCPETTRTLKHPKTWQVRARGVGRIGITPDAIFGLHYTDKPEGKNRAYFFLEVDQATMPVMRQTLNATSMYRKLIGYHATAAQAVQTRRFGIKHFRVLTVSRSPKRRRVNSLVRAAQRLPGLHGMYLFTDEDSFCADDSLTHEWVNGRGEQILLKG